MIGCLRTRVREQPIITLYFESENELKFYNLEAWSTVVQLKKRDWIQNLMCWRICQKFHEIIKHGILHLKITDHGVRNADIHITMRAP